MAKRYACSLLLGLTLLCYTTLLGQDSSPAWPLSLSELSSSSIDWDRFNKKLSLTTNSSGFQFSTFNIHAGSIPTDATMAYLVFEITYGIDSGDDPTNLITSGVTFFDAHANVIGQSYNDIKNSIWHKKSGNVIVTEMVPVPVTPSIPTKFEYKIGMENSNGSYYITEIKYRFLSVTDMAAPSSMALTGTVDNIQQSSCGGCVPLFIPRSEWKAPAPDSAPKYSLVDRVVIHHSGTANTSSNWASEVLSLAMYQMVAHEHNDIAFNWLIDPDGNVYEGTAGGYSALGEHMCDGDVFAASICLLGTYDNTDISSAAQEALTNLLSWYGCQGSFHADDTYQKNGHIYDRVTANLPACTHPFLESNSLISNIQQIRNEATVRNITSCNTVSVTTFSDEAHASIFPNPSQGTFTFTWESSQAGQVDAKLLTINGQTVWSHTQFSVMGHNRLNVQAERLPAGLYVLQLTSPEGTLNERVIIR